MGDDTGSRPGTGEDRPAAAAVVARVAEARVAGSAAPFVVLVEGSSDVAAIETLAARRGKDLRARGVIVTEMGGATNAGYFLELCGPTGLDVRLAGLCDAAEEGYFQRALERTGLGPNRTRAEREALGFFTCVADLEDELIRALGREEVERVIDEQGELASFRILQQQPAHRGRSAESQLRRFLGTRSGRKHHYARVLVEALDLDRVPRPLHQLIEGC